MNIDLHGVIVNECETDYGEYIIEFYPNDNKRNEVKREIPNDYSISHREHEEEGELVVWFVEQD